MSAYEDRKAGRQDRIRAVSGNSRGFVFVNAIRNRKARIDPEFAIAGERAIELAVFLVARNKHPVRREL